MKFIDLFAGLGGFHVALSRLGHECVFASEIDESLQKVYKSNFGIDVTGDIRQIKASDVPPHDILCGGFPCQSYSMARSNTPAHEALGQLYKEIVRIADYHKPKYLLLENVPNLLAYNRGLTWRTIRSELEAIGYNVPHPIVVSPTDFGIPQNRKRIYIVASRNPLHNIQWPKSVNRPTDLRNILDVQPDDALPISNTIDQCLALWQEFLEHLPTTDRVLQPIHSDEFSETHSIESIPKWRRKFALMNRQFYVLNKSWLDDWIPRIREFPASYQKLEWQCETQLTPSKKRNIYDHVIQMRPSGIRIKRKDWAPTLVSIGSSQVPIIAWERRYMTLRECRRLQSFSDDFILPDNTNRAFSALGNAVNVEVVRLVAQSLFSTEEE